MISNPFTDPRWAKKTVDAVDRWVDFVSDKTTRPLANIIRFVVFGVVGSVAAITILVLLLISLTRGMNELLDVWFSRETSVWVSYFALSLLFVLAGSWLMRKRQAKKS